MWIDVKKAYDSIGHHYLMNCIERSNLPRCIGEFSRPQYHSDTSKYVVDQNDTGEEVEGILQGDLLYPFLFMDHLSRKLNPENQNISVKVDNQSFSTNHLLFIDDLKLLSDKEDI